MADGGGGSALGPALKTLRLASGVLLIIFVIQIVMNKAEDRPVVACWPMYKSYKALLVDIPSVVLPKEHAFRIDMIKHVGKAHGFCTTRLKKLPGFHK